MANFYCANALTGGGTGALDKLDGAGLSDKDGALVITETATYIYQLDDDSGKAENSPLVVSPDTNPGTKRWILKNFSVTDLLNDFQEALDPIFLCFENEILCFDNEILTWI